MERENKTVGWNVEEVCNLFVKVLGAEESEVAVLRKERVDGAVLKDVTEIHLKEMGFPLGVRLKYLQWMRGEYNGPVRVVKATLSKFTEETVKCAFNFTEGSK